MSKRSAWTQLIVAVGAAAAVIAAATLTKPFYVGREPVASQLLAHSYADSIAMRAPWLHAPAEIALKTPQFLRDRELFVMDLLRTGHVSPSRARTLADVAVREAYARKVPPALVLGVMLTENNTLKSSARSRVGAVGLMQVYPKHWRGALGQKFGTNIHTDSTNLKYGIYILGWLAGKATEVVEDPNAAWRKALLSYNGCVHGKITRDCHEYPDAVRRQVELSARSSCPGGDFDRCVVQPMWLARRDTSTALMPGDR